MLNGLPRLNLILLGTFLWLGNASGQIPVRFSPKPADVLLTEANDHQIISLVVGQRLYVNLQGNPSTGYAWTMVVTNGDSVALLGPADYTPDTPEITGSGGTYSYPFQAAKAGSSELHFTYSQPWNPTGTARAFEVTILVTRESGGPQLTITRVGSSVEIRWPMDAGPDYYLEGATRLSPPNWAAANVLPLPDGANYRVTLGTTGPALYFRLSR